VVSIFIAMTIFETKTLDVVINGKLHVISLKELHRLILKRKEPAITKEGYADLKKLISLIAQIQIQGDWLLQSPWAIPNDYSKTNTGIR
jgi:hypothetical protein